MRFLYFSFAFGVRVSGGRAHRRQDSPLPPTITTPADCTEVSLSYPRWSILDPIYTTINRSAGGTVGDVKFAAFNFATGLISNCSVENIDLAGQQPETKSTWYNCSTPDISFQFNLTSHDLGLKETWLCDESPS
jgi:hypothetical protein